jgi:hypothetical protein
MPPIRSRRVRFTISAMMALVAGIAVLITLVLPLVRFGKPCCLTTGQTARWLLESPGSASCTNCHSTPKPPAGGRATLAIKAAPQSCPLVRSGTASSSCTACHTNPTSASRILPTN